jgi:hypothetical protein
VHEEGKGWHCCTNLFKACVAQRCYNRHLPFLTSQTGTYVQLY